MASTKLHDLPIEILECILVEVVANEVKDLKLAKRVWKEKADLVISRLCTVCSHWSSILTTDIFRTKVHRILDGIAQKTIRMEILHRAPIQSFIHRVATMKDEMFMLCKPENQDSFINVLDRNNMVEVKDVIPLPGILPEDMAAGSVSNCVYVLNKESDCFSVLRITENEEHQFNVSPWINGLSLSFNSLRLFVSVNGSLIILCRQTRPNPSEVRIYTANGSLQHAITLSPAIQCYRIIFSVIQKSNGNLVLGTCNEDLEAELKEIDTTGAVVRQYHSSIFGDSGVTVADAYGRIMIACPGNRGELLDSEFNLLDLTVPQRSYRCLQCPRGMHYNNERNEIVRLYKNGGTEGTKVLTIFRFTEE